MPITWNDLVGPLVDMIDRDKDAKAAVVTARTAHDAWPSVGAAVATPEWQAVRDAGSAFFVGEIASYGSVQDSTLSVTNGTWATFAARYIRDNTTTYDSVASDLSGTLARAIIGNMLDDSQTVDASAPSVGSPLYGIQNQGDGTATVAVNSDSTLAELPLAGIVRLRCVQGGFTRQNRESWVLEWEGVNPRTGVTQVRRSLSRNFVTGTRFFDVAATTYPAAGVSPAARDQIPQTGGNIHTGLNVLISTPAYNTVIESGDPTTTFASYSFTTIDGSKTNLSRRNTTFVNATDGNGTIYLRCVDNGGNWDLTWYQDSGLTIPLTNTVNFVEGTGDQTITWTVAAPDSSGFSTNGEHRSNGGHLATGADFCTAVIDDSAITAEIASFTVTIQANLPWEGTERGSQGDVISVDVTNAYAGVIERFFVQELGFAIPANNAGGETIADPA